MAVIDCAECSGKVSTLAAACPHCGAPVTPIVAETSAVPPQPPATPTQPRIEAMPDGSVPAPPPPVRLPSLDTIFRFKILGLVLMLSCVGYIGYLIVSQPAPSVGILGPKPDPSAEADKHKRNLIPAFILFVAGGWAFNAARSRQSIIEYQLQKKS